MDVTNRQISKKLKFFGQLLEILGEASFKIRAYERASETILRLERPAADMSTQDLINLPTIGKNIAEKITEYSQTGKITELNVLEEKIPSTLVELLNLDGIGPKTVHTLWKKLGIESIQQLETAARNRRIRAVKGFGPKKERDIIRSIENSRVRSLRMTRAEADEIIKALLPVMKNGSFTVAGSYRRGKSTIGDIDIVTTDSPHHLNPLLRTVAEEKIEEGDRRTSIRLLGKRVDIRFTDMATFGSMLMYLTGSKAFNIRMRAIAITKGWKLNEYGIKERLNGQMHTFKDEISMFAHLGLSYIPPELRENHGEVEAALNKSLPALVVEDEIKGDLHVHSRWSDGTLSLMELAKEGEKRGYDYILCTDHSSSLGITHGLDERDIAKQHHEIEMINRQSGCRILSGIEVDILSDGKLSLPDSLLADLDIVVAAVHSGFRQQKDILTRRIISAIQNDHVDIIAHPTGRLIGRRPAYDIDLERVVGAAHDAQTALEINASPHRLDLDDNHVRLAIANNVRVSIGTDTHNIEDISSMRYGIAIARRGWCTSEDVINTFPVDTLLEWVS
jgi:DNA polymerase (family 10)